MTTQHPPVLTLLQAWSGGQGTPALTWYGPDGERVELSAPVLANWVTKAINLLTDEVDAAPGTIVGLDLPMHWRTLVWALAAWGCGATVTLPAEESAAGEPDVLVSAAAEPPAAPVLVAIALPALARQVDDLPAGAIDGAAELMAQPDVLISPPDWDPGAPALGETGHAELAEHGAELPAGGRFLVRAGGADHGLRTCLRIWSTGGSVVLVGDPDADLDRIGAQEGARPLPG